MPDMLQIQELLVGYVVDRSNIQSVGNMTVIPIISDVEFTNVADINDVTLKSDPQYNTLEFKNASGNIGIVMQGWTMIDRNQHAQDRTVPYAHLIKAANAKLIPANCVQASQAGHFDMSKIKQDSFMILPPSLRGIAIKKATFEEADTGALWDTLSTWSKGIDCRTNGLQLFYSQFEDRLEQFVAQFEPVNKQLGAIVMINGRIIAIDVLPKYDSWKKSWRAIIRDSYGAEAVRIIQNEGATINSPAIDLEKVNSIEDLTTQYDQMKNAFHDNVQHIVGQTIQLNVGYRVLERIGELTMMKFENEQLVGQGVLHGDKHYVYLSLVSTEGKRTTAPQFKSLRREPYAGSSFQFT